MPVITIIAGISALLSTTHKPREQYYEIRLCFATLVLLAFFDPQRKFLSKSLN